MSTLTVQYSATESSITLLGFLEATYGGDDLYVKYTIRTPAATKDSGTITLGAGESGYFPTVTFTGLSAGTLYTIDCQVYNNSDDYTGVMTTIYPATEEAADDGGDSGGSSVEYTVTSMGTWSTATTSKTATIDSYEVLRYKFTPTSDGTLTFSSSTTGVDTIGWINNSTSCAVDSYGYPSYHIGTSEDDASGSAFSATAEVSANTTYYLYVCCYSGGSGTVTLNVAFEGIGYTVTSMGTWSSSITSKSASIGSYQVLRYAYTPTKDGVLTFSSSTTGIDTIGWIYSSTACVVSDRGYPTYYLGSYTDDANGTAFSATVEVSAYITYYLYVCCYNGNSGSVTLNVNVTNLRPSDWSWVTTVAQGSQIALTAAEWNAFTSRINEFREYAGLTMYAFTTAVSGVTPVNATICNEAHVAIDAISGHGTLPAQLVLNGSLYASFFNGLKDALNAIP